MTDEQIVNAAKEAGKRTRFSELVHSEKSRGVNSAYQIGFIDGMVEYREHDNENAYVIKGWVARDNKGDSDSLSIYRDIKPNRLNEEGLWENMSDFMTIPKDMFPEIKWEDEPVKIEMIIKKI